jgi:hypothetical protein
MAITSNRIVLPERAEAIDRIHTFNALDSNEIGDYRELAKGLSGLGLAYSTLALEYGAEHPLPGIDVNIGMWTHIGVGADEHKFTTTPQDIYEFGLQGASLWRAAVEGGTDTYYDHVNVPTDNILRIFLETDPHKLHQGWDQPSQTDIYASRIRTTHNVREWVDYWPFHYPLERQKQGPSAEESVKGYAQILQGLSATLLEIAK